MEIEFNVVLDRANCHIRAVRSSPLPNETRNDRPHKHYSVEFHCVFSGEEIITLPLENREIRLTAGNILLLPLEIYHGVMTRGTAVERICFYFSAEPTGKEPSPLVDLFLNIKEPTVFSGDEAKSFIEQCRRLCVPSQEPLLELRQGMLFANIALNLMGRVSGVQETSHSAYPLTLQQKWAIEDYISQHYTDNSGIAGLAKALYLSERQTRTLVKRYFGADYKTMIISRRMELAEIYLKDFSKRLEDIAYEVGYRSYSGFELCFKRYFGMSPQKMRSQLMLKKGKP